ncbi:MAG TPA: carboxypeptidase-like regulatory domain-containing protein, partial [Thermoanaerobaculia bacterium]|nr:carboxypeptidase-like regulatory domain-containing protein [Thermoanaerobaculia bacterium]
MKSVYRFSLALAVCLLLVAPVAVLAQTTGTIEGQVTDQSGAALPGVTVELAGAHLQGAKTGVTAADGRYRFLNLTPGDYTVTATLAGFGKVQKKATVTLDATATANLQLALSTTAEVTV